MPIYDFNCLKCGNQFTLILTFPEYEKQSRAGIRCPKCMTRNVEQRMGAQVQTSKKS